MLSSEAPIITIALVLYKRKAEESEAFTTLAAHLNEYPALSERFRLVVFDNSPETHAKPVAPVPLTFIGDTSNPGLAGPYNKALDLADSFGSPWLLLLDQDTQVTQEFLTELCDVTIVARAAVAALTPKLQESGRIHSPTWVPWWSECPLDRSFTGIAERTVMAYNSGACLRVRAIREIGGFPVEYWLDYLDHAIFHLLQQAGGLVQVLDAVLKHRLSLANLNSQGSHERFANFLSAERRYYRNYGSSLQRIFVRVRQLKQALSLLLRVKDKRYAFMCALSSLRLSSLDEK